MLAITSEILESPDCASFAAKRNIIRRHSEVCDHIYKTTFRQWH